MYDFSIERVRELYEELNQIVPITFRLDDSIGANAMLDVDRNNRPVIKYKTIADEQIGILHELIHVRMFYRDSFCKLAWRGNVDDVLHRTVEHIRNIVDDTYVFTVLYDEYDVFPISPVFFTACRDDLANCRIQLMEGETGVNKTLVGAWRIRIAELSMERFANHLLYPDRTVCTRFVEQFSTLDADFEGLLEVIRSLFTPEEIINPNNHAQALIVMRDHVQLQPNIFHLATHRQEGTSFPLRPT
jgi:hypothetical protein